MKTYCTFLRGVNVNKNIMKMAEARDVLQQAGLTGVVSVLASGNLIFQTDRPQYELRIFLERVLSDHYGGDVSLFIKNSDEISEILAAVPYAADPSSHIYAFICEAGFEEVLLEEFNKAAPAENESAEVNNGFFYWRCRKGETLDSNFSKILGRRDMKDKFTSRNIGTIVKIAAKMGR